MFNKIDELSEMFVHTGP